MEKKNKFNKKELVDLIKKRRDRGLIKKKIEKFGDVIIESPIPFIGGAIGVIIALLIAIIGNRNLMKLVKNKTWNKIFNFLLNFLFGWFLLPIRYFFK